MEKTQPPWFLLCQWKRTSFWTSTTCYSCNMWIETQGTICGAESRLCSPTELRYFLCSSVLSDESQAFVVVNGFPESLFVKAHTEEMLIFPWEAECLLLFSPSEALISRIINPDLCNPTGTLCSLHQRGPSIPEINHQLIAQSIIHPFGQPSVP